MRFPKYIPLMKGKTKVTKDLDTWKFSVSTPLLPEYIVFEGLRLECIPLLKMEYWDFVDLKNFPHLVTHKYMQKTYYDDMGVTILEPMKCSSGVEKLGFLNLQ